MASQSSAEAEERISTSPGINPVPVLHEEDPWTSEELSHVRAELALDDERLRAELNAAQHDLSVMMRDSGEGAGDDQADAGAATWEREHEMSLANNARALMEQTEHAIERIDSGGYGFCESCSSAVGKQRLQAFPRATLCVPCKKRQERR